MRDDIYSCCGWQLDFVLLIAKKNIDKWLLTSFKWQHTYIYIYVYKHTIYIYITISCRSYTSMTKTVFRAMSATYVNPATGTQNGSPNEAVDPHKGTSLWCHPGLKENAVPPENERQCWSSYLAVPTKWIDFTMYQYNTYIYHMKYRSYLEWDIPSCIWIINHKPWIVIGMHIRAIFLWVNGNYYL